MRRFLLPLLLSPLLAASAGAGADGALGAWRLGPSDFARYAVRRVTEVGGEEIRSAPSVRGIHGHDFRDAGRFLPVSPRLEDLPSVLAFQVPVEEAPTSEVRWDLALQGVVPLRMRGRFAARILEGDVLEIRGQWTFASRGRGERGEAIRIARGVANVLALYPLSLRLARQARVTLSYRQEADGERGKARTVEQTWDFDFEERRLRRYEEFESDVNGAVERGVAWLRTRQQPAGAYEPHGDWRVGSTALAVLTLAACGVPRHDPAIERALAWICLQRPVRTYDQALALMALERAYTPPDETTRAGPPPPDGYRRDLPPDRLAFCARVARELERGASSPGSWGYPPAHPLHALRYDTSNTQYAVLGLQAAGRLGIPVAERTWLGVLRHCELVREPKGPPGEVVLVRQGEAVMEGAAASRQRHAVAEVAGFRYATLDDYASPWASMTAAAITCLAVARHELRRTGSRRQDAEWEARIESMIVGGWAWLDRNWGMDRHPGHPRQEWWCYYLYSLERAAVLSGIRYVGGKDWYFEGAAQLLAHQDAAGAWDEKAGDRLTGTCFALLFLRRATTPLSGG